MLEYVSQVAVQILSISTSRPSRRWVNATVTIASRCACRQCRRSNSPLPGRASRARHGVWPPSATGIDSDSGQRKLLLSNVFCSTMCLSTCRDGFAGLDFELAHAEWCDPVGVSRLTRHLGQAPAFGTFAAPETPKRSSYLRGDPHLITRSVTWPTSRTVNAHLHRLPM